MFYKIGNTVYRLDGDRLIKAPIPSPPQPSNRRVNLTHLGDFEETPEIHASVGHEPGYEGVFRVKYRDRQSPFNTVGHPDYDPAEDWEDELSICASPNAHKICASAGNNFIRDAIEKHLNLAENSDKDDYHDIGNGLVMYSDPSSPEMATITTHAEYGMPVKPYELLSKTVGEKI